jgi:hypothetical protein
VARGRIVGERVANNDPRSALAPGSVGRPDRLVLAGPIDSRWPARSSRVGRPDRLALAGPIDSRWPGPIDSRWPGPIDSRWPGRSTRTGRSYPLQSGGVSQIRARMTDLNDHRAGCVGWGQLHARDGVVRPPRRLRIPTLPGCSSDISSAASEAPSYPRTSIRCPSQPKPASRPRASPPSVRKITLQRASGQA